MVTALAALHAWQVYAVVAGIGLAEGASLAGFFIPGGTALVAIGLLASNGTISLPTAIVLGMVAAFVGDSTGFWFGRFLGPRLENCRLGRRIGAARWARGRSLVTRRGSVAVAVGRWIGPLRALMPSLAGGSGMSYRAFLLGDGVAVATYVPAMLLLGFTSPNVLALIVQAVTAQPTIVVTGVLVSALATVAAWTGRPVGVRAH